jgi:hypothetical protein
MSRVRNYSIASRGRATATTRDHINVVRFAFSGQQRRWGDPDDTVHDVADLAAALSIVAGGGKWIEIAIPADALYQHFLVTAERRFWRCVQTGETPRPYGVEPPRPRLEAFRVVDMSESNSWAELASLFCVTRSAFLDHERAKSELKALMPEDAKEASGHGVRAKRSKSGAVSFDLLATEENRAVF